MNFNLTKELKKKYSQFKLDLIIIKLTDKILSLSLAYQTKCPTNSCCTINLGLVFFLNKKIYPNPVVCWLHAFSTALECLFCYFDGFWWLITKSKNPFVNEYDR